MNTDCQELLESLGRPINSDLLQHALNCESCRRLLEISRAMEPAEVLTLPVSRSRSIRNRVLNEIARGRRGTPWWRDALILVAINLAVVAWCVVDSFPKLGILTWCFSRWHSWQQYGARMPMMFGVTLALALVILTGPWVALSPTGRHLKLVWWAIVAVAVAVAVGWRWQPIPNRGYAAIHTACVVEELLLSALPVGFAVWAFTRRAYDPLRTGIGVFSCAMTGVLVARTFCGAGTPHHAVVSHLLPWLMVSALGIFVRRWIPSKSFAP